jgi:Na+/melibiose symporter-like transporter
MPDRSGYFGYALTGGLVIFATVVISTLGTASRIPYLEPAPTRRITLGAMVREMAQTLNNRAFIVGVLTMIFIAVAVGARNGLELYFGLYFWELKQWQLGVLATISTVGGFLGVALAPVVSRILGKKHGCIAVFATAVLVHITPVSLRLLDLAPPNGSTALLWLIYGEEIINATLASATAVLLAAIVADVVEDAEVKTGRRSEGLLMSANALFRKMISGTGIFVATAVLAFVQFPDDAKRGGVPEEVLTGLGIAYIPLIVGLYGISIGLLFFYDIDRKRHEANLAHLKGVEDEKRLSV